MPIPLIILLAGAGAAALRGKIISSKAQNTERQAESMHSYTRARHEKLFSEWEKEKADFIEDISAKQNAIQLHYDVSYARTRLVFDRFGHPAGDISHWPLPPGMDEIEAITVPPLPDAISIEGQKEFDAKVGSEMRKAQGLANVFRTPDVLQSGGQFALAASVGYLTAAAKRQDVAVKALTEASEYAVKITKIEAEAKGIARTYVFMCDRAELQHGKVSQMVPYIDKYATVCEQYMREGRGRQTLTDEEYQNVRYLARIMWALTEEARKLVA